MKSIRILSLLACLAISGHLADPRTITLDPSDEDEIETAETTLG